MKKGYFITLAVLLILVLIFGFMWYITKQDRNKIKEDLENAQQVINTLNTDKEKLIIYITEKDNKIKELQTEYKEKLKNIPKDTCGDQKPSKELLEFLRNNVK